MRKLAARGARWTGNVGRGVWVTVLVYWPARTGRLKEEYRDKRDEWGGGNRWL